MRLLVNDAYIGFLKFLSNVSTRTTLKFIDRDYSR